MFQSSTRIEPAGDGNERDRGQAERHLGQGAEPRCRRRCLGMVGHSGLGDVAVDQTGGRRRSRGREARPSRPFEHGRSSVHVHAGQGMVRSTCRAGGCLGPDALDREADRHGAGALEGERACDTLARL